ncbi:UNVERIFIED_CONTAM: hypothetical protein Sradi_0087000 [Sesamum radiatum]|uniref:Uncharacterized protein n=1 Tax=Sesamum radiatum TaxID=300843 RepID=A0AAW2WL47_SESRA
MADSDPMSSVGIGSAEKMDGGGAESLQEDVHAPTSQAQPEEIERKARVDAVWQQMNKGVSAKTLKSILENQSAVANKPRQKNPGSKSSTGWKTYLGLGLKKTPSPEKGVPEKCPSISQNGASEDAKKLAAAALSAVKDAAAAAANAGRGKVEITEVRDFAGEDIEVKKLVDAASKEAAEKGKGAAGATSAVDAVLEQIKRNLNLACSIRQRRTGRADYREFERERDARLALQAKRRTEMRDDL